MHRDPSPPPAFDRVLLREHVIEAEIGAFSEERGVTQRLIFNLEVDLRNGANGYADDVDRIFSYDLLVAAVEAELAAARMDLLETLAEGICDRLLAHPRAARVQVRIEKPDRVSGRLGVEIARSEPRQRKSPAARPAPQVFCLAESAWMQDWFPGWVARLPAGPVALAVEGARIQGLEVATQRIRFLASETAAWAMLAAVPGADVVASRTELVHAFGSGRRAIWAPSKMIFAAQGLGDDVLGDFGRAVGWFAAEMNASGLTYVGRAAPEGLTYAGPVRVEHPGK